MRDNVASALFQLIYCFPSKYQLLMQQIVEQQRDVNTKQLLHASFEKLMSEVSLDVGSQTVRAAKNTFKQNFETFVIEIQGLLCIK